MKAILAALAASVLFTDTASAIPQTVNGFLGAVGMNFDQYAASAEPWAAGAELKGPWKSRAGNAGTKPDGVETLVLGTDATVLGIPAAQVTAERVKGAVQRFTVIFDERKLKNANARTGGLYEQVLANLTALAGEAKIVSPGGEKAFRHESSLIIARKSGGKNVIVEFTPAR